MATFASSSTIDKVLPMTLPATPWSAELLAGTWMIRSGEKGHRFPVLEPNGPPRNAEALLKHICKCVNTLAVLHTAVSASDPLACPYCKLGTIGLSRGRSLMQDELKEYSCVTCGNSFFIKS